MSKKPYYTAADAIEDLKKLPPDTPLVNQRDPEGNGYSPTSGIDLARYVPTDAESQYAGDVFGEDEREYLEQNGLKWEDTIVVAVVFPKY